MRSPNQLLPPAASLNLTSMIDVVFLLIIFFLVSSNMIQQETSVELRLPVAKTGQFQEDTENSGKKEVLNVLAEGNIFLRNLPITIEELQEYFRTKREQGERNIQVEIRTNREVPARVIKPILVICAQAGIWDVAFATIQE